MLLCSSGRHSIKASLPLYFFLISTFRQDEDSPEYPAPNYRFEVEIEKYERQVFRQIQRLLSAYKDEKRGPTYIAVQSPKGEKKYDTK